MRQVDQDYEAASMAAAARFRKEIEEIQTKQHIKAKSSLDVSKGTIDGWPGQVPPQSKRSQSTTAKRRRPLPLTLAASIANPQTVQSARLPPRTSSRGLRRVDPLEGEAMEGQKQDWRRMTIAGGKHTSVVMMSSSGHLEEFDLSLPPVPSLSDPPSPATLLASHAPRKPIPTEDQIRRELEAFAIKESPNIQLSRRSSLSSRRRATYFPDPEDVMYDQPTLPGYDLKALPSLPSPAPPPEPETRSRPSLSRSKSIFGRFERKNEVDTLLDMYLTEEQIEESRLQKRKSTKTRRLTLFRRKPADVQPRQISIKT